MKATYIYGIRVLLIDKYIYVGKSNNPEHRYGKIGNSHNECVQGFVGQKGEDNFRIEELEEVKFKTSEDWIERERFWKQKLESEGHPLCNKNDGGGGVTHHTEKSKRRMSGENNPMYGRKGKDNPNYGRHHTEETKAKMGGKSRREWTLEEREKRSERYSGKGNPFCGKHHTKETKQTHSEFMRDWYETHDAWNKGGEYLSKEVRQRVGEANAKPYPALYNIKTGQYISSGVNFVKLCSDQGLNYDKMYEIKSGNVRCSRDGWRLVSEEEMLEYGND